MESTGVYWVALFLLLQEYGFEVFLVNAKHVKNVTGIIIFCLPAFATRAAFITSSPRPPSPKGEGGASEIQLITEYFFLF